MAVHGEAAQGDCIQLAHGGGGALSQRLIRQWLMPALAPTSTALHDAALLAAAGGTLAVSTDSFVVKPLVFAGGDIGRLAVLGSLNDLAMVGGPPAGPQPGVDPRGRLAHGHPGAGDRLHPSGL